MHLTMTILRVPKKGLGMGDIHRPSQIPNPISLIGG